MLYREISRILGSFLLLFSIALLFPLAVAGYDQFFSEGRLHQHTTVDFLITLIICVLASAFFLFFGRQASGNLYRREGIAAVVLIWLMIPAISAIPFVTSGTLKNPLQAYFEMVSGFTTTGSTVLHAKSYDPSGKEIPITKTIPGVIDRTYVFYGTVEPIRDPQTGKVVKEGIEAVDKTLLFWRSFSQWLGGVGIVVLFVAILPLLGVGGKMLFQTEIPGPMKEGMTPRIKETAIQLWKIYLGLTLIQIVILKLVNSDLPFFEALLISFSTISTGGFSSQNTSIAGYHSIGIEWVVLFFMFLGSVNFSLYNYLLKGKFYRLYETEFMLFLIILAFFCGLNVYSIVGTPDLSLSGEPLGLFNFSDGFRQGAFQMVSAMTTTGFITSDYDVWPYTSQILMLIAMYIGGMSGSTAGGIKIIRQYMLFRIAQYRTETLFRMQHLRIFKLDNREVDNTVAITVLCFFLIVVAISTLGTVFYVFDGIDLETSFSLTACMVNNTGVTFRGAGPEYSCAFLSNFGLFNSILMMIFGRLEYYAVLAMLIPAFWQKDS